ncbi:hypothetical protein Tco_1249015 [Tanacetum coccineum]
MQVLDHTTEEEVKDAGIESMGGVTFEQVMDEYDQKNSTAQEQHESPYDTESEIKFIKSFKVATISPSLSIDLDKEEHTTDEAKNTFLGSKAIDIDFVPTEPKTDALDDSDSGLKSMHDDDLASSSIPSLIADALKAHLPDLLSEALKNTLPQMLKDSIKQSVQDSIKENLSLFDVQVQQTLQDQLPRIVVKPMNKQFNAFNTLESRMLVILQKNLTKVIQNKMGVSIM